MVGGTGQQTILTGNWTRGSEKTILKIGLSFGAKFSSKADLNICLHYPLILADILMATFFLNKELVFWNKTFNLKGEEKKKKDKLKLLKAKI